MKRLAIALTVIALTLTSTVPAEASLKHPTKSELKAYALGYITAKLGTKKAASQYACFDNIINRESHWNPAAQNGKYYGLGQMSNAKPRHRGKPYLQVRDAYKYMVHRYGSPCGAWSFWKSHYWY
jgi:hypothetical protein